jgi:hypothetical protein
VRHGRYKKVYCSHGSVSRAVRLAETRGALQDREQGAKTSRTIFCTVNICSGDLGMFLDAIMNPLVIKERSFEWTELALFHQKCALKRTSVGSYRSCWQTIDPPQICALSRIVIRWPHD